MPHTTFFVSFPMTAHTALATQEPKGVSDKPASPTTGGAPAAGTQAPGSPQAPAGGQPASPCGMDPNMMLMLGLVMFAMWLLVMRPENKRRKQQQEMLAAIKVGDHVVTLGGMHGSVAALTDKTITLRVDTTKMVFDRSAIARVERDDATAAAAEPKKN